MRIVGLLHGFLNICSRGFGWCVVTTLDIYHGYSSESFIIVFWFGFGICFLVDVLLKFICAGRGEQERGTAEVQLQMFLSRDLQ